MTKFCRYDLRTTTDVAGARKFYSTVLGHDRAPIWPLHENAIARGAKPHWLGRIGVADVEQTAAAFVERGAERFGPIGPTPDGGIGTNLRDPGGAVLSIGTPPKTELDLGVVWHVLNTTDVSRAAKDYRELFGWQFGPAVDLGADGRFRMFSWQTGGASVGSISDLANHPGIHPHWLFFFEVDALDAKLDFIRAAGGKAFEPVSLRTGERLCVCDDPQGAAFGLRERR